MNNTLYNTDKKLTFLIICLIAFILFWIKKYFIEYETTAFEFLQDRPEGGILKLIAWLQSFAIPLVFLWKFCITAFVVWIGAFAFGYRITYFQCISVVMAAEFVFFLASIVEIFWFLGIDKDASLYKIMKFYPLSLMNFFDPTDVKPYLAYPLRALNVFEIFYVIVLIDRFHFYTQRPRAVMWRVIAFSYVLLFILWLAFYMLAYK